MERVVGDRYLVMEYYRVLTGNTNVAKDFAYYLREMVDLGSKWQNLAVPERRVPGGQSR